MDEKIKKRGQLSIFIIISIILVGLFLLFFILRNAQIIKIGEEKEINPDLYLQSCIEDKARTGINLVLSHGGYTESPFGISFKFEEEDNYTDISYLCYTQNYYIPCINQEPLLIKRSKKEIKDYISGDVENCFNSLKENLEEHYSGIEGSYEGVGVNFTYGKAYLDVYGKIIIDKGDEKEKKENFKIIIPTKLYNLEIIAQEIISQEARFCNFDATGYMLNYPETKIEKFRTSDSETIYLLTDRKSEEVFKFAIRGCVIPPGI